MAVGQPAAPTACTSHAAAAAASPADEWVAQACRVCLDAEGNVITHIPALLAGAVNRLVVGAAAADAALLPAVRRTEVTRLHGCRPPGISISAYAERLLRYCKCSPVVFVAAFVYLARLQRNGGHTCGSGSTHAPLRVDAFTAHRLIAVGVVVATKFFDDKYYSNEHYSQVAGVTLADFNAMEIDFLFRLDFRARVETSELCAGLREMEALAGGYGGHSPTLAALLCPPSLTAAPADLAPVPRTACGISHVSQAAAAAAETAAAAAAAAAEEGEDSCSDATTTLAALSSDASEASEDEGHTGGDASLPWGAEASAALVGAPAASEAGEGSERTAPPRRSKKRCSAEAHHLLMCNGHCQEEQQRLAETVCQA